MVLFGSSFAVTLLQLREDRS